MNHYVELRTQAITVASTLEVSASGPRMEIDWRQKARDEAQALSLRLQVAVLETQLEVLQALERMVSAVNGLKRE